MTLGFICTVSVVILYITLAVSWSLLESKPAGEKIAKLIEMLLTNNKNERL